jgi:hypothetical protein
LGLSTQLYDTKGNFALLADLTNIVRIGDLVEVDGDQFVLHEVKTPGRKHDSAQTRRAQAAIDAVNQAGPIPDDDSTWLSPTSYPVRTHIKRLRQLARQADRDGSAADVLESGWVTSSLSLALPDSRRGPRFPGISRQELAWNRARTLAHRRAGLDAAPVVHAVSTDPAGRHAEQAPWGAYPLNPETCARIICDYLAIESSVSLSAAAAALRRHGAEVTELPVPQPFGTLDVPIVQVDVAVDNERIPLLGERTQYRSARISARALRQPLLEATTLDSWAGAIAEMTRNARPDQDNLILVFDTAPATWR